MTLMLDIFEPVQIENLVEECIPVLRTLLNEHNFADYFWTDWENTTVQVERKSIDEILSNMDRVEGQLRKEIYMAERTYLLYEGTFEPCLVSDKRLGCHSFHKTQDGKLMVPGHKYNLDYMAVMAWFDQLDRHGITVVHTIDYKATASLLVALYKSQQKTAEEHTTFKRNIKPKVYPTKMDPAIQTLMGLVGVDGHTFLGEALSTALLDKFGTVWNVFNATPTQLQSVPKIGNILASKILNAIGRK